MANDLTIRKDNFTELISKCNKRYEQLIGELDSLKKQKEFTLSCLQKFNLEKINCEELISEKKIQVSSFNKRLKLFSIFISGLYLLYLYLSLMVFHKDFGVGILLTVAILLFALYIADRSNLLGLKNLMENYEIFGEDCAHLEEKCIDEDVKLNGLYEELEFSEVYIKSLENANDFFGKDIFSKMCSKYESLFLLNQSKLSELEIRNLRRLNLHIQLDEKLYHDSVSASYSKIAFSKSGQEVDGIIENLKASEIKFSKTVMSAVKMLKYYQDDNISAFHKMYCQFELAGMFKDQSANRVMDQNDSLQNEPNNDKPAKRGELRIA